MKSTHREWRVTVAEDDTVTIVDEIRGFEAVVTVADDDQGEPQLMSLRVTYESNGEPITAARVARVPVRTLANIAASHLDYHRRRGPFKRRGVNDMRKDDTTWP